MYEFCLQLRETNTAKLYMEYLTFHIINGLGRKRADYLPPKPVLSCRTYNYISLFVIRWTNKIELSGEN